MRYLETLSNRFLIIVFAISMINSSCSKFSSYILYVGNSCQENANIFLQGKDSSYIYSYNYNSKDEHLRELGYYKISNDTLILQPQVTLFGDSASIYLPQWYSTYRNDSVIADTIRFRYYLERRNYIDDITLSKYYPNDSNAMSFYESFPLYKVKIINRNNRRR